MRRREFLTTTTLGFGAYLLTWSTGCQRRSPARGATDAGGARSPHGTFTATQYATLRAATERLLPHDQDPGALDLGVPEYIDASLADKLLVFFKRPLVIGLDLLESTCRTQNGQAYTAVDAAKQDALLLRMQKGTSLELRSFEVLLALTLEGAFGDPKYGGNRGGRGFAMVGFTPGPVMPRVPVPSAPIQLKSKGG